MDTNQDALSKVIINGQEYDASDAQALIERGQHAIELEEKYSTKLDTVVPAYNEASRERAALREELAAAKRELEGFQAKKDQGITTTPTENSDAIEAARKLGLTFKEDLGNQGFIKKEDLDSYWTQKQEEQRAISQVSAEADRYEKEIDGSDGRPSFNKKAVVAYASMYKMGSLMEAYEDMNKPQLDSWKQIQIEAKRAESLKTMNAGGKKEPAKPRVTRDNFKDILGESLNSSDE